MDPNARLSFSLDTLSFDTVFTTIGSVTLNFRVYNPYNKDIVVSKVSVKGEMQSPFNINVDGIEGGAEKTIEEVVIRAKDSMYVFVEVKLDANNSNLPLIIKDSIEFITNSNTQYVQLSAYGQDVHHLRVEDASYFAYLDEAKTIKAIVLKSTDLIGDKPYLVHDHIIVDSLETLTLKEGVILYMRKDISLFVKGTLKIEGTKDDPVQIRGDRLDELYSGLSYDKVPGQWGYIHLLAGSMNNEINYASIVNGVIGVRVDSVVTQDAPTLKISNSIIQNMTSVGIYALGAEIFADNCVVSNCVDYNIYLAIGGFYDFVHCTIGNYYNWGGRNTPSVALNNYYETANKTIELRDLKRANFYNSIIYGTLLTEVGLLNEFEEKPVDAEFNYLFDHCIIRGKNGLDTTDTAHFKNVLWDKDPLFVSPTDGISFEIDSLSPAVDAGNPDFAEDYPEDFNGYNRLKDGLPDLGAFEFVPKTKKE